MLLVSYYYYTVVDVILCFFCYFMCGSNRNNEDHRAISIFKYSLSMAWLQETYYICFLLQFASVLIFYSLAILLLISIGISTFSSISPSRLLSISFNIRPRFYHGSRSSQFFSAWLSIFHPRITHLCLDFRLNLCI